MLPVSMPWLINDTITSYQPAPNLATSASSLPLTNIRHRETTHISTTVQMDTQPQRPCSDVITQVQRQSCMSSAEPKSIYLEKVFEKQDLFVPRWTTPTGDCIGHFLHLSSVPSEEGIKKLGRSAAPAQAGELPAPIGSPVQMHISPVTG